MAASLHKIGPTEVGLVTKRFSFKKLTKDNPVAFNVETGYQADLLMPGLRWMLYAIYSVDKYPWVQVPAGEIGVVIAQVGNPLPIGAKSAVYKKEFANFSDLRNFIQLGGQKGVQRPVLPPGSLVPVHPVGFLIITRSRVYGEPISPELCAKMGRGGELMPASLGLRSEQLELVRIEPQPRAKDGSTLDVVGIVTTYEGDPLPSGDIASRLGGFVDVAKMETDKANDAQIIEALLGSKNNLHNNYQDFQSFLDHGGHIGLQHDPLLYGAYALNPRCYAPEIVPTAILNLNWADANSEAHNLDSQLQQIVAKSKEGFIFKIDLQVQIHVPDTKAPRVISMVGTMKNLVNEVLQAAVGNHFRNSLQSMPAINFIETRQQVQVEAFEHIRQQLEQYQVETKGVYIQDVILPEDMVTVLTHREVANQEIETFKKQRAAQDQRIEMEQAKGTADMQADLARSKVGVNIKKNNADARVAEATGEAEYIRQTGTAKGAEVEAVGLARARGYRAQVEALGSNATAIVNVVAALAEGKAKFMPDVLVTGGGNGGGALDGLAATAMRFFGPTNGGSGTGPSTHLPLAPLGPEGEAALKKLMPKETGSKT